MDRLHVSENIMLQRRKKGITQEELAKIAGVTKASVSKWETGQSLPDIILLPRLAAYFDVTVDELLGYEPYLTREEIQKWYHRLADAFAGEPFEEVMDRCRELVKKYYSCYPFLVQISVLWINHFMLAEGRERQQEILEEIEELCRHILKGSKDMSVCSMASNLKGFADLQMGRPERVVESVKEVQRTNELVNNTTLLVQAYLMLGQGEMADQTVQVDLYHGLCKSLEGICQLLYIHREDQGYCAELIRRGDAVVDIFDLEHLNPNNAAGYYYQSALILTGYGEEEKALNRLEKFIALSLTLLREDEGLHGDSFFNRLDDWIAELDLGNQKVRNSALIRKSIREALENPVFSGFKDQKRMEKWREMLS